MAGGRYFLLRRSTATRKAELALCLALMVLAVAASSSDRSPVGPRTFGFDIHHRFSDPVKRILPVDGLPEEGTIHYYAVMVHRDQAIRGRRLAASSNSSLLTFRGGNETFRISTLGFLHYVNVTVGTPPLSFLVALDTGSNLFWLPCDCTSCVSGLKTSTGRVINLNKYSPNASSSSHFVTCGDPLCINRCDASSSCPYQVEYLSESTGSYGYLVQDRLHLVNKDAQNTPVTAKITFGCGKVLTGAFLTGGAPNGLFGLGMSSISVPNTLATEGYVFDSFSMCFGPKGIGTITFGDQGSLDQAETPFILRPTHPTYNVSITQVSVGGNNLDISFNAIFDSGTSFTMINEAAYSSISENFDALVTDKRFNFSDSGLPFGYCYAHEGTQDEIRAPSLELMMKGEGIFKVTNPIAIIKFPDGLFVYCLAIIKGDSIDIIGQNFMEGYRIVFNREKNILGWKLGNCSESVRTVSTATASASTIQKTPSSENRKSAPSPSSDSHSHQVSPMVSAWLIGGLALLILTT